MSKVGVGDERHQPVEVFFRDFVAVEAVLGEAEVHFRRLIDQLLFCAAHVPDKLSQEVVGDALVPILPENYLKKPGSKN